MNRLSARMLIGAAILAVGIGLVVGVGSLLLSEPASSPAILRIAERGRLILDRTELPRSGQLVLLLSLDDSALGSETRPVRVIAGDGRRLDTTASRMSAEDSDLRLEIDPTFLTPGLYMIEVDSAENHPLNLRRYVIELR